MHRLPLLASLFALAPLAAQGITYPGVDGPARGKRVVLVSGDEEYRSEESLPMLGKLLARRHGFQSTVLFAIDRQSGAIDPDTLDNIPGLEALQHADLLVIITRFRNLPPEQMRHIDAYLRAGKPVIGLRPSVVAFRHRAKPDDPYARWSCNERLKGGFGRTVLGADWIAHHGRHGRQSTRGLPFAAAADHPILRGVGPMWGPTDVYAVRDPIPGLDTLLVDGQVLAGMRPDSPPADKPHMPLAWTRHFESPAGPARVFMSTMGDAQDFQDANFRRLVVNACYWAVGLEDKIPDRADVRIVGAYNPRPFGFRKFAPGRPPAFHALDHDLLHRGDRVCLIGNTLADRMQHHGWLETFLQARYPDQQLVVRNLGFAADELTVRPRSMNFGDPDVHLAHSKADVVFAFFGYNESFAGRDGLPEFRRQLAGFIDHTRAQRYNGRSAPRLVLFAPIAHEDLGDPNLPDGSANNARLALYTAAMAEVARDKDVLFVDLFAASRELYAAHTEPLTGNGIHLNETGYRQLGQAIDELLAGSPNPAPAARLAAIRAAVLDKNLRWFNRYRATDGYSTFGQRAFLKFTDGQTNKEVMDRELEILDVMTANRDRRIWALAAGRDEPVDDSNLPRPLEVKTNFNNHRASGKLIRGRTLDYLGGEAAIAKMRIAAGMAVQLFASEERFPELVNPVQMSVDTDGRLWVAAWPTYPHGHPLEKLDDKLLIFPDDDGDGRADRCVVFADGLHNPTGFEFFGGGVLVACPPEILFLEDTDGDDRADRRTFLVSGIDSADTHCGANSFVYGPDGGMYFSEGIFHFTNIETPWGPPLRTKAPMVYRFDPRTHRIAEHFYVSPNPHGLAIDTWGRLFATDATSGRGYYVGYPQAGTPHELYKKRVRPVAGIGRISGSHFPPENRGNLLICNTIGFRGILQHRFEVQGADIRSVEVDVEIGGDGALYFLDWHNAIIGHMQHNLRDPSRDHRHGRIYRVTAVGRPLLPVVKMRGRPVAEVVRQLASPEDTVRYRARLELSGRPTTAVLAAARQWLGQLDPADPADALALTEALWLHQQHNRVDRQLLVQVLGSPVAEARAAATRTLGQLGDRLHGAVELLQRMATDPAALVRAEAIVAATRFPSLAGAEVLFRAAGQPVDAQITYDISQARKVFDPVWRTALARGEQLSAAATAFVSRHGHDSGDHAHHPAPRFARLLQDSSSNYLHLHVAATPRTATTVTGIAIQTKARAGQRFTLYQLRPAGSDQHAVVQAASFTADGKSGERTIGFAKPWQLQPGDLLAHSGTGGPAYELVTGDHPDVLYYPVPDLPARTDTVRLAGWKQLPRKRRYALRILTPATAEAPADVVIRSVPQQLKYDTARFTVKAGQPFVLRFENPDHMPHNMVFVAVGALEEVGVLADKLAADPEAAKQHFVPKSDKVLFSTPVVDDQSKLTIRFTAPAIPGDYPYLCTLPGHWRIMNGVMRVEK